MWSGSIHGVLCDLLLQAIFAPIGPLYRLVTPFSCWFLQASRVLPADILFAGLAPLFIGVEQVDMQIPSGLTVTHPTFGCLSNNQGDPQFVQIPVHP
jgi:uncharacterized protein (TIGR03437 family)